MKTLQEIRTCGKPFLTPADVVPFLRCDPYNINLQAKEDPQRLGFPVCVMGTRVRIPTAPFVAFFDGIPVQEPDNVA